ncbi:phosphatase domain-containing putative toxin [Burkholderia arboris]|uniref:phosphatase domain-containing putative toxin n=1 Tax=Burkholderia arboris TaxID=488730 RepID=UPI00210CBBC9|nr:phosphatase [Burkholderia arboris]UTV59786.1 phosphatase [Burkholderia arboris]
MTNIAKSGGFKPPVTSESGSDERCIQKTRQQPQDAEHSARHPTLSILPRKPEAGTRAGDDGIATLPRISSLRFAQPERELDPVLTYDRTPPPDDQPGSAEHFRYFRTTSDLSALSAHFNREGLDDLRLSGSETISTTGQVERIARSANIQNRDQLHIVDVRQESHVVAGRYALTLRGLKDWANVGLSHEEALQREADWIGDLRRSEHLTIHSAEDMKSGVRPMRSVTLHRPEIVSEQALVERTGANYARLTVTDHLRPGNDAVDRFVDIVRQMPSGAALHVHCKGGRGRTTTFMAIYDMLRNARRVSADGIIDRQGELGHYQLRKIDGQNAVFRQDRLSFLYAFHEYARQNPDGQPQTWSAWLASRPDAGARATDGVPAARD